MRQRIVTALVAAALLWSGAARAEGEQAGDFDYYVLALSWSPTWCALEGAARGSPQCDRPLGWVLHGLWPQYETGWPSYCHGAERDPSRSRTAAMADIMGTDGAAWYQWKKHGRCSGLSAERYFDTARAAYARIARPEVFRRLDRDVKLPAAVVEEAFLKANPGLEADEITVTCKAARIEEVRICLTRDLAPRRCGADVIRDCTLDAALFEAID
ncbi:ribonuclease T2 family protein [Celeribacter indicus]|uniref:Ribonuclease T2 family protein n=1 Tax=Celeribacter indicus TaxID=1208324 RepID=A0A0B5DZP0_9RHOB|nr:ribonuclease T2 [Celeribacter indicus]AJE48933.1 ribonuclease T2 family protein [Celeribacter indicus]SDW41588.1 ribonuclease T2 [Celeribacter indicus]